MKWRVGTQLSKHVRVSDNLSPSRLFLIPSFKIVVLFILHLSIRFIFQITCARACRMHWADSQNTVVSSPYSLSTHSRIYHHRNFTVMMSETVQWTVVKVWHSWCGFPVISTIRCHSSYKRNCTCVQNKIHLHFWGMIRFALPSVTP